VSISPSRLPYATIEAPIQAFFVKDAERFDGRLSRQMADESHGVAGRLRD
jgi:hypothetical protein